MVWMQTLITWAYYGITAATAVVLLRNFVREKDWQREVFYLIVLVPFLLRVLRLK